MSMLSTLSDSHLVAIWSSSQTLNDHILSYSISIFVLEQLSSRVLILTEFHAVLIVSTAYSQLYSFGTKGHTGFLFL